jgi:hypothetical protein
MQRNTEYARDENVECKLNDKQCKWIRNHKKITWNKKYSYNTLQ